MNDRPTVKVPAVELVGATVILAVALAAWVCGMVVAWRSSVWCLAWFAGAMALLEWDKRLTRTWLERGGNDGN